MFRGAAVAYRPVVATPSHVLLLNASSDESEMYAVWLAGCGYRVTVTRDLASARRVARRDPIDVLVIDALFGRQFRRGEFQRRWARLAHRDALGIVVISGHLAEAHSPQQLAAHELCAAKPCLPQHLSGLIDNLLSGDKGNPLAGCPPS
jgi:DNA-binding response OmpR family regulator